MVIVSFILIHIYLYIYVYNIMLYISSRAAIR